MNQAVSDKTFWRALVAVTRAEFPKRRIPWCAVANPRAWAGRNQPSPQHFLKEAVRHQALTMDPAQFVRPEHTPTSFLEHLQFRKGFSELFVWRRHWLFPLLGINKYMMACENKYIA
jgi:hypothetical protein